MEAIQTRETSLTDQIAAARRDVMAQRWAEQEAKEMLEIGRWRARVRILDGVGGDWKQLGGNEKAQQSTLEGTIAEEPIVMDYTEALRIAAHDRERAELALQVLLDAQSAERWAIRGEAVARGVSLGDGAS